MDCKGCDNKTTAVPDSSTDFAEAVNGRPADEIIPIVDELMTVLQAVNPRLYAGVMRKLRGE